jgi:hypothetical protein
MSIEVSYIAIPKNILGGAVDPAPNNPTNTGPGFSFPLPGQGTTKSKLQPYQVVGFIPLKDCTLVECREYDETCCYENRVYATIGQTVPGYENDWSSFLVNFPMAAVNPNVVMLQTLEKFDGQNWNQVALLNSNTYGIYYAIKGFTSQPGYTGYGINWAKVLALHGKGCYRYKITSQLSGGAGEVPKLVSCQISESFILQAFNCDLAHQTVKFETNITGKIGDIDTDGRIFNLCGITWYDSIRFFGFFGYETTPEYLTILQEFQTGLIKNVRDEAIQRFKLITKMLPKYIHDRFKSYGLLNEPLMVSDYNINNSDYNIKRKSVVKDGAYEPQYKDKQWRRLATVEVDFKEGIQAVIKSNCCEANKEGPRP